MAVDPVMKRVISAVGDFQLKPVSGGFRVVVRAILSQQISTAAAATIRRRLEQLLPGGRIRPEAIRMLTDAQFQSAGVSQQKRAYLRDLTDRTLDGSLNFRRLARESDEAAIAELIQVKGVGRWTAQMYLIFSLGRPDIFAPDDLGLRNAIVRLYGLPGQPSRNELEALAFRWAPYRSMASWYLWRALEQEISGPGATGKST